ncbi:MAG: hypothetical protein ABI779_21300 [Acidobacteriota bacterium]
MPLPRKLIHVAWMAIVLGMVMEVIVLVAGGPLQTIVRDTLVKVAWSSIVCFGVAAGAAAAQKVRVPVMGLAGLFAAPAGFAVARVVQKAFSFGVAQSGGDKMSIVLLLATMKAGEYLAFGLITGWLASERFERAWQYALAGALTGLYFGGLIATVTTSTGRGSAVPVVANEVLFPVGCALVLFASKMLTAHDVAT